jgi:hypothetical protein
MGNWIAYQSRLIRIAGIDQIEEIDYSARTFTRSVHLVNGPGRRELMDRNALEMLAADLQSEIANSPAGADVPGLKAMLVLIRESLPKNTGTEQQPQAAGLRATRSHSRPKP